MEKQTTITAPQGKYIDIENSTIVYKDIKPELPKTFNEYINLMYHTTVYRMYHDFYNLSLYEQLMSLRNYYNDTRKVNYDNFKKPIMFSLGYSLNNKTIHIYQHSNILDSPFILNSLNLAKEFKINFEKELIQYFQELINHKY
jgi:hypothetical protein